MRDTKNPHTIQLDFNALHIKSEMLLNESYL